MERKGETVTSPFECCELLGCGDLRRDRKPHLGLLPAEMRWRGCLGTADGHRAVTNDPDQFHPG